jgi:AsmA protein
MFVMRALKIAVATVAAVIVAVTVLLMVGIPSGFLTSAIQARVERETGFQLTVAGSTRIGLWPSPNVTFNDVTLQDLKNRDTSKRLTVGSVQADVTLSSVWSGHPQITQLAIVRPTLYIPLRRERTSEPVPSVRPAASGEADADSFAIDRVTITEGTIVSFHLRDRVEHRLEGITADARIGDDRRIKVTGSAHAGEHPLKFEIKATAPTPPAQRQSIPVELMLDAADLLPAPLTVKAEARLNGSVVMINGVTGTFGDGTFNGWAAVDFSSKPLVKLDLDFQRLDVAASKDRASSAAAGPQAWSNATIDLNGLNYIDTQLRVSAAALNIGQAYFAPVALDTTLASGVLKATFSNLGAYGGQGSGQLILDVSSGNPVYTLTSDLVGVRALPLLRSVADFDKLDGKLQAKIAVRSSGNSQRAIMSNLGGIAFAVFQDGAIKGLNVAQMIRSLTTSTLSGWQEGKEQATDLSQLSASFRIERGQATTTDLNLIGPLVKMTGTGTIDLAAQALALRVEPKLVLTTEGQGRTSDPVGLGIPVVIDGPWAQPRIYPETAGILDNPDAAYAKLKEMGKGLFGGILSGLGGNGSGGGGSNGTGPGSNGQTDGFGGKLGETLGNLLQQGLGPRRSQSRTLSPSASAPDTPAPAAPVEPAQSDPAPDVPQDSAAMNEVLKQLFNR